MRQKLKLFIKTILISLILFGFSACVQNNDKNIISGKYKAPAEDAYKELFFYLSRNFVPGGSISVSIDNELIWSQGIGVVSTDLMIPASTETKFRIADVSQVLTALTFNTLVEKGILDPDLSVKHYLPELPDQFNDVTLQNLSNHISGIRTETTQEFNARNLNITIQKGIDYFKNDTLLFEPGSFQSKSMYNYNLLGVIIEQATNKNFDNVVKETVIDNLGLHNTVPDKPLITIKNRTDFYDFNIVAQVVNALDIDLGYSLPANGYLSTTEDLVKLGNAFLYSENISNEVKARTFTKINTPTSFSSKWSNGWFIITKGLEDIAYGSKGQVRGGSSALLIYPKDKIVVAMATNLSDKLEDLPVFQIAQIFIDFINPEPVNDKKEQPTQEN